MAAASRPGVCLFFGEERMLLRLATLMVTAVVLVPSAAHLFELPNKIGLDRDAYFTVQAIYAGWAWFALPIVLSIALNAVLFMRLRRTEPSAAKGALVSALMTLVGLGVFFAWVFPANVATSNWIRMPDHWQALRRDWEWGHAAVAGLAFAALFATAWAVTARRGSET